MQIYECIFHGAVTLIRLEKIRNSTFEPVDQRVAIRLELCQRGVWEVSDIHPWRAW